MRDGRRELPPGTVELYWIPLGADAHVVRISGAVYEALAAFAGRRPRRRLFHSALVVTVPEGRFTVEMTPIPDSHGVRRGVIAVGPVGMRWLGRFRVFRYEIRRWRDGRIPDVDAAIGSPVRLIDDVETARRVLEVLPLIPTPVWGRDELGAGEMWNSNSVVAWALTRSGVDLELAQIRPPGDGRAPGWDAGIAVAARAPGIVQVDSPARP